MCLLHSERRPEPISCRQTDRGTRRRDWHHFILHHSFTHVPRGWRKHHLALWESTLSHQVNFLLVELTGWWILKSLLSQIYWIKVSEITWKISSSNPRSGWENLLLKQKKKKNPVALSPFKTGLEPAVTQSWLTGLLIPELTLVTNKIWVMNVCLHQ